MSVFWGQPTARGCVRKPFHLHWPRTPSSSSFPSSQRPTQITQAALSAKYSCTHANVEGSCKKSGSRKQEKGNGQEQRSQLRTRWKTKTQNTPRIFKIDRPAEFYFYCPKQTCSEPLNDLYSRHEINITPRSWSREHLTSNQLLIQ